MTTMKLLAVLLLVAVASAKLNAPAGTAITNLPGYSGPPLSMYSGYVSYARGAWRRGAVHFF